MRHVTIATIVTVALLSNAFTFALFESRFQGIMRAFTEVQGMFEAHERATKSLYAVFEEHEKVCGRPAPGSVSEDNTRSRDLGSLRGGK